MQLLVQELEDAKSVHAIDAFLFSFDIPYRSYVVLHISARCWGLVGSRVMNGYTYNYNAAYTMRSEHFARH